MKDELAAEMVANNNAVAEQAMKLLSLIWSTEKMTFFDLCNALRPHNLCPVKGDTVGWSTLFKSLGELEKQDLIECEKEKGRIKLLILSPYGANTVREYADNQRGLLENMRKEDTERYLDDSHLF